MNRLQKKEAAIKNEEYGGEKDKRKGESVDWFLEIPLPKIKTLNEGGQEGEKKIWGGRGGGKNFSKEP